MLIFHLHLVGFTLIPLKMDVQSTPYSSFSVSEIDDNSVLSQPPAAFIEVDPSELSESAISSPCSHCPLSPLGSPPVGAVWPPVDSPTTISISDDDDGETRTICMVNHV